MYIVVANPWGQVLTMVEERKSDMAGCSQFITNVLTRNIDFTINPNQICLTFLVPKAQPSPATTFLIQPFYMDVWICLVSSILFIIVLWNIIIHLVHPIEIDTIVPIDRTIISINILRIYTAGVVFFPRSLNMSQANKLFFAWLLIHSLLMYTYYSAGLSSIMSIPRLTKRINTLQDMVDYKITYQGTNYTVSNFLFINSTLFSDLAHLYRTGERLETPLDGTTALIVKTLENSYVTDIEGFDLDKLKHYKALKECLGNYYMGFVLQKNSPFTVRFDSIINRVIESGISSKWLQEIIYMRKKYQDLFFSSYLESIYYTTITSERLYGGFILLAMGHLISIIVFIFEVLKI